MNLHPRSCALSLLLWSVPTALGQAAPKAPTTPKPAVPVWKPAATLLGQLAAPVTIGKFQVRPPKGYAFQSQRGPLETQMSAWLGPARANGTRPYLMMGVVTVPAAEAGKNSAEQILDKFLQSIQTSRGKDWKRTPTQRGRVNGVPFVRARWSGSVPGSPFKLHGFNYVALMDGEMIQLSSQDVEPVHGAPLALAEAAALTFKLASH